MVVRRCIDWVGHERRLGEQEPIGEEELPAEASYATLKKEMCPCDSERNGSTSEASMGEHPM